MTQTVWKALYQIQYLPRDPNSLKSAISNTIFTTWPKQFEKRYIKYNIYHVIQTLTSWDKQFEKRYIKYNIYHVTQTDWKALYKIQYLPRDPNSLKSAISNTIFTTWPKQFEKRYIKYNIDLVRQTVWKALYKIQYLPRDPNRLKSAI